MILTVLSGLLLFSLGTLPGFFAGIYAPPNQPRPFKSPFFRVVSGQSLLALLASCALFYLNWVAISTILHLIFAPKGMPFRAHEMNFMAIWPIGTLGGFLLGISRALRRAKSAL